MIRYLVSYQLDGSQWNIEIPAKSYEDARRRIEAISHGEIEGEIHGNIPASIGWAAPLITWWRNFRRSQ